jgi:hypothetical protein
MTKKDFKEKCDVHQYGRGQRKKNAIFFDWKIGYGFKFMVKGHIGNVKRKELFNILYDWVTKGIQPPYYVEYQYAMTDEQRFKVPIIG